MTFVIVIVGLIEERPDRIEEFTSRSNRRATTEFGVMVIGNGALESVTEDGVTVGVSSQTELSMQDPNAAPEWFSIVSVTKWHFCCP